MKYLQTKTVIKCTIVKIKNSGELRNCTSSFPEENDYLLEPKCSGC